MLGLKKNEKTISNNERTILTESLDKKGNKRNDMTYNLS